MTLRYFDDHARQWPAPDFTLKDRLGREVCRHHFRDRCNLIFLFLPDQLSAPHCQTLAQFAAHRRQFRAQEAEILLFHAGETGPDTDLTLLHDRDGKVSQAYAALSGLDSCVAPYLFILDRYGAPFVVFTGQDAASPRTAPAVLAQLITLQLECPE